MYTILNEENILELFSEADKKEIHDSVLRQILNDVSEDTKKTPDVVVSNLGCVIFKEVPNKDKKNMNLYVEYFMKAKFDNKDKCNDGALTIIEMVVYDDDDMPDYILDRYNKVQEIIAKHKQNK